MTIHGYSGVATVGHGCPPCLGHAGWVVIFAQIRRVFRSMVGGSRLRMSLKVHHISSMNTSQNAFVHCTLYRPMHIWLLGASPPDPHWSSVPGPHWGIRPQTSCVHPTSKPWLRHCQQLAHRPRLTEGRRSSEKATICLFQRTLDDTPLLQHTVA